VGEKKGNNRLYCNWRSMMQQRRRQQRQGPQKAARLWTKTIKDPRQATTQKTRETHTHTARTIDAEKPLVGRAERAGRPGRAGTPLVLRYRTGPTCPGAGQGRAASLPPTWIGSSTNCQPPGYAVARKISCCPARKLKCSFARVKKHPPEQHHPLDAYYYSVSTQLWMKLN
jgi:hypothetical protein